MPRSSNSRPDAIRYRASTDMSQIRSASEQTHVSLSLDFRNPQLWQRPWPELYAEILDFVEWSQSVGFEGAWVPEHHAAEDGYQPSPLVLLAAIAARTKRLKLGSGVALAPLYHPVRFAEDCAVLASCRTGGSKCRWPWGTGGAKPKDTAWISLSAADGPTSSLRSCSGCGRARPSPSKASTSS